jgi:PPK2 family polyphosphate:nucleotide phosphotransferase
MTIHPTWASQLRVKGSKTSLISDASTEETYGWDKESAKRKTEKNLQALEDLQYHLYADSSKSLLIVLQGIDAGGKDGAVRNVFTAFNPQGTTVTSFKAPAGRETSHDYLWRVHAACPSKGSIAVFNRSHYEDLIVPIVQKRLPPRRVEERFQQIRDFELMLSQEGTKIVKFLLHISRDEQWGRLMARLDDPHKNWKFSMGDLAERERWPLYTAAFKKIVTGTSVDHAPWYVIPAALIVAREVLVSALREWMAEQQQRDAVAVGMFGKWKTTLQMIALGVLLATDLNGPWWLWSLGYFLINVAMVLALWSMFIYLNKAWPQLKNGMK